MANEGSTKPTYSELETALEYERHVKENYRERMRASIGRFEKAESSLARVRGLLQRISEAWTEIKFSGVGNDLHCTADRHYISEIDDALAESADIGKLETADESGKVNSTPHSSMVEPSPYKGQVTGSSPVTATISLNTVDNGVKSCEYCARYNDRCCHCRNANGMDMKDLLAGSAETGGEKAEELRFDLAEQELNAAWNEDGNSPAMCNVIEAALIVIAEVRSRFATFPHPPQNQTVASGVEGAHAGTTADKKTGKHQHVCEFYAVHYGDHQCACGLRTTMHMSADDKCAGEPEKLNNAQKSACAKCGGSGKLTTDGFGGTKFVECYMCKGSGIDPVALAEFSVSSHSQWIQDSCVWEACSLCGRNHKLHECSHRSPHEHVRQAVAQQGAEKLDKEIVASLSSPPPCEHRRLNAGVEGTFCADCGEEVKTDKCFRPETILAASPELLPTQLPPDK